MKMKSNKFEKPCKSKGRNVVFNQMYSSKIGLDMPLTCDEAYLCKVEKLLICNRVCLCR